MVPRKEPATHKYMVLERNYGIATKLRGNGCCCPQYRKCILKCYFYIKVFVSFLFFFVFCHFRPAPVAYGGSQARGRIRAGAASLRHSHSNTRSKPCLWPTPQLTATLDPQPTKRGQGSNLSPHGYKLGSLPLSHKGNTSTVCFELIFLYGVRYRSNVFLFHFAYFQAPFVE